MQENLNAFFGDFDQEAVIGNSNFRVFFSRTGGLLDLGAEGRRITALATTGDVAAVRHGDKLTTGNPSKTYEIVGIDPVQDGLFTLLLLKE